MNQLVNVVELSTQLCESPIQCKLAYATSENFLGRIVDGYYSEVYQLCLMTLSSAKALCKVQNRLNDIKLGLFVFDSYRPLRAVRDFKKWMHQPPESAYELERKKIHYPHIEKNQLAELGYVCDDVSNHCFGDTVDLSLVDLTSQKLLEMGSCFDFFDEISYPNASVDQIGEEAYKNRKLLSAVMQQEGFIPYEKEFWHFTFNFREIEKPLDVEVTK